MILLLFKKVNNKKTRNIVSLIQDPSFFYSTHPTKHTFPLYNLATNQAGTMNI